jgi:hypothetical protein
MLRLAPGGGEQDRRMAGGGPLTANDAKDSAVAQAGSAFRRTPTEI